ncbi:Carbonic anhydrase or acetyltransferase, isoleucine patch superfamily [Pseudonocardia ammonioxydans]|uniref:Carbonic anhydrase or acetyltransferase, isoleucine patch superfamily n=1 Tax=Pseudonocardia ammonioxydans TaxID=260086 RepID=A0A1I4SDG6_PSUAM|nr:gamma carbonic anhydrase family protein [Pseudonocardia ammonioxydans]SFM62556.1 Carbonic anhydrase or acetyltransferase, isoleucine patch superfamily [Pseudonocardia ammonioxydans]
MPLFALEGLAPTVHPDAFVAPTATLVGDVHVEAGASIWYNAVLRADLGPIVVRAGANVQDGSVLHGGDDPVTEIGAGATIGHLCVVHGCVIGPRAVIGNGSTVQDGAVIGEGAMVAAGSTVAPNVELPADRLMLGSAAKERGGLTEQARWWVRTNPDFYQQLARRHAAGVTPAD